MNAIAPSEREDGSIVLATRIPRALHKRVKIDAFESRVSLSEWVTDAITSHLARMAKKGARPDTE